MAKLRRERLIFFKDELEIKKENQKLEDLSFPRKSEVDIFYIDSLIRKNFRNKDRLSILERERLNILKLLDSRPSALVLKLMIKRLTILEKDINSLRGNDEYNLYIQKSTPILEKYKILCSNIEDIRYDVIKNEEILSLIDSYLIIASDYINFNISSEKEKKKELCPDCSVEMNLRVSDNILICPECKFEKQYIDIDVDSLKEIKRMVNKSRDYKSKIIFEKAFNKFQGIDCFVDPNVYEEIENYCSRHFLPTRESMSNVSLNKYGTKDGTSKKMMFSILKEISRQSEYSNVSLICSEYWGWKLPDLSEIREKVFSDYDKMEMELAGRKINAQYKLFRLLKNAGFNCVSKNFKIVSTEDILQQSEKIYEEVCSKLGWKFIRIGEMDSLED